MAYFPQSSGKIKHIHRTLKITIKNLCQETHLLWDQLLPIALLRIRPSPTKQTGLSPVETLLGCPPHLVKGLRGDLEETGDLTPETADEALRSTFQKPMTG
jgi:hypothetical protein